MLILKNTNIQVMELDLIVEFLKQGLLFYYVTVASGNASHCLLKFQITAVLKISEKLQVLMINDKFGFLVILQPHVSNLRKHGICQRRFPKSC